MITIGQSLSFRLATKLFIGDLTNTNMSGMQYKDLKVGDIIKSLEDGLAYYVIDLSDSLIM